MDPYPKDDVQTLIRHIVRQGEVILTSHAKEQMKNRNYDLSDVRYILKTGEVVRMEQSEKGQFKYVVKGEDLEGEPGAVVTAIINKQTLVVVTVLGGV